MTPSPRSDLLYRILSEVEDAESNQMDEDELMMTDYGENNNDFTIGDSDQMDLD